MNDSLLVDVGQRIVPSDTFWYQGPALGRWRFMLRQYREVVREQW